tara:strand:+ start:836 stop:1582 length:747 start_codon:yes stop_codon:yes gene_type:complete
MEKVMHQSINNDYMRWVIRAWRYRLRTEKPEINFLLRHLRSGQVVLDIGAHKGAYTYWMSNRVGKSGHVYAFEPQPSLNQYLSGIAKRSKHQNIHIETMALSSKESETVMNIPGGKPSPSASLKVSGSNNDAQINVHTTTLDNFTLLRKLKSIDLIKCDVEGHELDILLGGKSVLERYKPVILLECEARHNGPENVTAVFDFFTNLNYEGYFYDGSSFKKLDNFDLYKYQTDPNRKIYVNNFFFAKNN